MILLHVVIAAVLSGLIGLEREREEKPAGIRTNMLVGGAVALLVALGQYILAVGITAFILFINYFLGILTGMMKKKKNRKFVENLPHSGK